MKAHRAIAWNLSAASSEFGVDRETIRRRLVACGERPDRAGCFRTKQIVRALFGDVHEQKMRLAVATAHRAELEAAKLAGDLIELPAVIFVAQRAAYAIRQRVIGLSLPEEEKRALLAEIHALGATDFANAETELARDETDAIAPEKSRSAEISEPSSDAQRSIGEETPSPAELPEPAEEPGTE